MKALKVCFSLLTLLTSIMVIGLLMWSHTYKKLIRNRFYTDLFYNQVWKHLYNHSNSLPTELKRFKMVINEEEFKTSMDIMGIFAEVMEQNNLTYMLDGGSLLGSYRHHGPIPWDDDLDVMVDERQKERIKEVLESLYPEFILTNGNGMLKLHSGKRAEVTQKQYPWKWPFLDIFWFRSNDTHIHCLYNNKIFKLNVIFPLYRRPYGGLEMLSPCKVEEYFSKFYTDWTRCLPRPYDHRHEWVSNLKQVDTPCEDLKDYYPLVQRSRAKNGQVTEKLIFDGKEISKYSFREKCIS